MTETRRRIVVADNDPAWLGLIVLDLELEGHEVVGQAHSGADALASCAAELPDVLVVDHRMPPGPHGLEVAQTVRAMHPEINVVVFTNYEDPALRRAVELCGARFVLKTNLRALREMVIAS
jgi:CheY-like chemotaxis protein